MVKHLSTGGGAPITSSSPIYEYGVDTGNPKPPMTDSWPADRVTRKLPLPVGETPKTYSGVTPPRYSESGSNYPFKAGKSAVPNVNTPSGKAAGLDRGTARGIPDRDSFNRGFGRIGSGVMTSKAKGGDAGRDVGVSYRDGDGNVKRRGRSG